MSSAIVPPAAPPRRRGRPPLPDGHRKLIGLRLTEVEEEAVTALAAASGMTRAEYLRSLVAAAIRNGISK